MRLLRTVRGVSALLVAGMLAFGPAAAAAEDRPGEAGVIIVLDTSGSMAGARIKLAREVAESYLRALPGDVPAGLVTFSGPPVLTVPPTLDRARMQAALDHARAKGRTQLYDAVALAAATMSQESGQRKLLVLSDGEDTHSVTTLDDAIQTLRQRRITADMGVLDLAPTAGGRDRLVHATGGRMLTGQEAKSRAAELAPAPVMAAPPTWPLSVGLGSVVLAVLGVGFVLAGGLSRATRRSRELAALACYRLAGTEQTSASDRGIAPVRLLLGAGERILSSRGRRERLVTDLELAALSLRPAEWLLVRALSSIGLGVLLMALGMSWFGGFLGLLLGWLGTRTFVKVRISRRRAAFAEQLPDTLQLVVGALRAGFSLPQALDAVVRDDTQPIAGEFARALARTRLGMTVEDALDKAAERMESADFAWVVMAIRIQRQVGGNLAELLLTTVHTMRDRSQLRRHVKGLSAEGKLSAYVLIGLPIAMATWMFVSRGDYIAPLYTHPIGWLMSLTAVVSVSFGWFWMSKLVKVEV